MSADAERYPDYDATKVDLCICPLTGQAILRSRYVEGSEDHIKDHEFAQAKEHTLSGRAGPNKIWIFSDT